MTDLSATIVPKSDQLNTDDLLAGPKTIKITKVTASGAADQPICVHFEGDHGKPYKPCKSMRRVMVALWGSNGAEYAGRSLTLYADPKVKWGGIEVGGIRISHASHIENDLSIALTMTRGKREPTTIRKLVARTEKRAEAPVTKQSEPVDPPVNPEKSTAEILAERLEKALTTLKTADTHIIIQETRNSLLELKGWSKEQGAEIRAAILAAEERIGA